jgi:4a-hydroxytetrahydrobiopterin dehydratase
MEKVVMSSQVWIEDAQSLRRSFHFQNYHEVMAFVNAVAWIAHQEDHHPDLSVHYNRVDVLYTTHDAGGLTAKDRHCVQRVDALLAVS